MGTAFAHNGTKTKTHVDSEHYLERLKTEIAKKRPHLWRRKNGLSQVSGCDGQIARIGL